MRVLFSLFAFLFFVMMCGAERAILGSIFLYGEFDPGSERTLAAWIRHASRTDI